MPVKHTKTEIVALMWISMLCHRLLTCDRVTIPVTTLTFKSKEIVEPYRALWQSLLNWGVELLYCIYIPKKMKYNEPYNGGLEDVCLFPNGCCAGSMLVVGGTSFLCATTSVQQICSWLPLTCFLTWDPNESMAIGSRSIFDGSGSLGGISREWRLPHPRKLTFWTPPKSWRLG